jgi:hypothetical protein
VLLCFSVELESIIADSLDLFSRIVRKNNHFKYSIIGSGHEMWAFQIQSFAIQLSPKFFNAKARPRQLLQSFICAFLCHYIYTSHIYTSKVWAPISDLYKGSLRCRYWSNLKLPRTNTSVYFCFDSSGVF